MKNKWKILATVVVAMILIASVAPAKAYFTTYATAKGGHVIELSYRDRISEEMVNWVKHINITAEKDAVPQYIRVKVFYDDIYPCTITYDSNWTEGATDEFGYTFYNFTPIVYAGQSTLGNFDNSAFDVKINFPEKDEAEVGTDFNVIIIYECTQVLYGPDGKPLPADWSRKLTYTEDWEVTNND